MRVSFTAILLLGVSLTQSSILSRFNENRHIGEKRLIEFNETHRVWMTRAGINECGANKQGFMDITDHLDLKNKFNGTNPAVPVEPYHKVTVREIIPLLSSDNIVETVQALSAFKTRYYTTTTGIQAAEYLESRYKAYANGRSDISVRLFTEGSTPQKSVIARIEGAGSKANEIVIIGGHEDSINGGSVGTAPGSDDDASGSSVVLEVFRVIVESGKVFDRTLEFHAYAAEEVGLVGSQDIADVYASKGVVVAGMMQMDMAGYVGGGAGTISFATDYTSSSLTQFSRTLVDAYVDIEWVNTQCGYGCSDHASWNKAGYLSVFPFETPFSSHNPNIHTSRDTLDKISASHMLEFAKLALGFVMELGLN